MAFLFQAVLADLQQDFQFHKPLHEGSIVLETGIRRYIDEDVRLSHSELLALTLNEIGMERGWGKTYWIPDAEQIAETGSKASKGGITPNLIYEDRAWAEDDIAEYRAMDHGERWVASAPGRRNGLYPNALVLPIRLIVHETEGTTSLPAQDVASVMLYYRKGEAYLGWMKDWLIKGSSSKSCLRGTGQQFTVTDPKHQRTSSRITDSPTTKQSWINFE